MPLISTRPSLRDGTPASEIEAWTDSVSILTASPYAVNVYLPSTKSSVVSTTSPDGESVAYTMVKLAAPIVPEAGPNGNVPVTGGTPTMKSASTTSIS